MCKYFSINQSNISIDFDADMTVNKLDILILVFQKLYIFHNLINGDSCNKLPLVLFHFFGKDHHFEFLELELHHLLLRQRQLLHLVSRMLHL